MQLTIFIIGKYAEEFAFVDFFFCKKTEEYEFYSSIVKVEMSSALYELLCVWSNQIIRDVGDSCFFLKDFMIGSKTLYIYTYLTNQRGISNRLQPMSDFKGRLAHGNVIVDSI